MNEAATGSVPDRQGCPISPAPKVTPTPEFWYQGQREVVTALRPVGELYILHPRIQAAITLLLGLLICCGSSHL
jgi:hypothetical protein